MKNFITLFYLLGIILFSSCVKDYQQPNAVSSSLVQNNSAAATKKNVIVFLMDDIGYEVPTYTGGQSYQTPNLDACAANGLRYTYCHSAPLCSPTRFMLLTGKYNMQNYTAWGMMDPSNKTIANMFREAGYATCVSGKWQLNGGITSMHAFGFDSSCVFDPFTDDDSDADDYYFRYKNPTIYCNGKFWPDSMTKNKYGPDIFLQYAINFIDSCNKNQKPFFIYFSSPLCHAPFSPTPDDVTAYKNWNPLTSIANKKWFPSMVKYMDKILGKLKYHLDSMQLSSNTAMFVMGDNGTPPTITSLWNGKSVVGGKGKLTEGGTHVPSFVTGLNKGSDSALIDFTDYMPTLASICNIPVPTTYGILDGYSFWPVSGARPYIFCYYDTNMQGPNTGVGPTSWAQDKVYKSFANGKFYNIAVTPEILIPKTSMTTQQKQINQQQKNFINLKLTEKQ